MYFFIKFKNKILKRLMLYNYCLSFAFIILSWYLLSRALHKEGIQEGILIAIMVIQLLRV